ncbi:DUF2510 domain-containing protein [Beutenbergia cavernae]|uniref:DUF2510 domain-containing protein n=1 Tax=Beutenbergia cavernae TaxID=84757 RepID=UPI0016515170|nr:DUF2510 domain-containing protein [Beutenbergia cavernae]
MTREPGWYPDPEGERQVRFWDGDAWTEYVQPFAPEAPEVHGAGTAAADYPYLSATPAEPGTGAYPVATWADAPVRTAPAQVPGRGRGGLYLGIAVAVVVALVIVGATLLTRGNGPGPGPGPTGGLQQGTPVVVGTPASDTLATGSTWEATLTIPEDGAYLVDLAAQSGGDLVLEIVDDAGDVAWRSDDRGRELVELMGGASLDPGGIAELTAGEHLVRITEYDGLEQGFDLRVDPADATALTPGLPGTLDVPAGSFAVAVLPLDALSALTVDVRTVGGSGDDPRMVLLLPPDGDVVDIDDRTAEQQEEVGGAEYDPYLETDAGPGNLYVLVGEYQGTDVVVEVTVTLG